jgi:hypothetical protein
MKVDSDGNYTAHGTVTLGGQFQDNDWSGSISVKPDCTASVTTTYPSFAGLAKMVIFDNGTEMRLMEMRSPLGPVANMAYMRRISWGEPSCTADMVRGTYAGWREGTLMMPGSGVSQSVTVPYSALVTFSVASGGALTAASTASMGGTVGDHVVNGSVQVNPDCTATMNWSVPSGMSTGTIRYVVLNYGNELIGIDMQSNGPASMSIESDRRISIAP